MTDFIDPKYSYELPPDLVANKPAEPRDSARLLVCSSTASSDLTFSTFKDVASFLPSPALLVINETKVVPARTFLQKQTGGKIEVFFLVNEWSGGKEPIPVMVDRKLTVGDVLNTSRETLYSFKVISQTENIFYLQPLFEPDKVMTFLQKYGQTPVPKYIKGLELSENELRARYQTVFAANPASVAAPTASLHFTPNVFDSLTKKGIEVAKLSLHVGLGTFASVQKSNIHSGKLHTESFTIPAATIDAVIKAKQKGIPVIAVGTTVVRALESAAHANVFDSHQTAVQNSADYNGQTSIFIKPPYNFKVVTSLITNFHTPNSSLMMLVQAFLEYKKSTFSIGQIYKKAINEKMRFYSFGDSMLIL